MTGAVKRSGIFRFGPAVRQVGREELEACYDIVFSLTRQTCREGGGVIHGLIGMRVIEGKLADAEGFNVECEQGEARLIEKLLKRWPVVVQLAWVNYCERPGHGSLNLPEYETAVHIMLHTQETALKAVCPVNKKTRDLKKGELVDMALMAMVSCFYPTGN